MTTHGAEGRLCPMQFNGSFDDAGTLRDRLCVKDDCAWWMPEQPVKVNTYYGTDNLVRPEGCAVFALGYRLLTMDVRLPAANTASEEKTTTQAGEE